MSGPLAVEPVIQKAGMDCGAACLAMYLSIPYRQVSDAAMAIVPDFLNAGITRNELKNIAAKLGYDLERTRKFTSTNDGVLFLQHRKDFHWVLLFNGSIINPSDGLVWVPEAYFNKTHFRPITLMRTVEVDSPPKL